MNQPKISIILPVFNGEKNISKALNSVLNQTLKAYEIVVINDGSVDGTLEILKQFGNKITCIHQKNMGPNHARNAGIKASKGEYIAFIDDDDEMMPHALEHHNTCFSTYQNLGVSHGYVELRQTHSLSPDDHEKIESKTIPMLLLQCAMFKKVVFDKVGLFDKDLFLASDLDMFLRVKEAKIPFAFHEQVVAIHNRHQTNSTGNKVKAQLYLLKAIKKAKERREISGVNESTKNIVLKNAADARRYWHTAQLI